MPQRRNTGVDDVSCPGKGAEDQKKGSGTRKNRAQLARHGGKLEILVIVSTDKEVLKLIKETAMSPSRQCPCDVRVSLAIYASALRQENFSAARAF